MTTGGRIAAALLVLCVVIVGAVILRTRLATEAPAPADAPADQSDAPSARVRLPAPVAGDRRVSGSDVKRGGANVPRRREMGALPDPSVRSHSGDEAGQAAPVDAPAVVAGKAQRPDSREVLVNGLSARGRSASGAVATASGLSDEMAAEAGLPDGTRFAAPLVGTTVSLDGTEPIAEKNTDHTVADGVYFPPDAELAYPNRSGVQEHSGTVALWVEPVDWAGDDASVHSFFRINDPNSLDYIFHLLKNGENLHFQFVTEQGASNLTVPIDWWPRGESHHVAATWGDATLRLYVDGVAVTEQRYAGSLNVTAAAPGWWGSNNPLGTAGAGAILQGTLVADRPLNQAEVQGLWQGQ